MTEILDTAGNPEVVVVISVEERLKQLLIHTVPLVPAHLASQLTELTHPQSLATMAAVASVWIGSHLLGAGELADIVLLVVGYSALGGTAIDAGEALYTSVRKAMAARSSPDYSAAAQHLAKAISLLGVELVLALLLRRRPKDTFKNEFRSPRSGALPQLKVVLQSKFPRNGRYLYKPKLVFSSEVAPGYGATSSWTGDILVSNLGKEEEQLLALYHEKVHSFLVPKLYFLRNLRVYIARSGYVKSYILRYLEEALAETISRVRVHGFSRSNLISGLQFPITQRQYYINVVALGEEARGICYGPINVGGMVYNVFDGTYFDDQ